MIALKEPPWWRFKGLGLPFNLVYSPGKNDWPGGMPMNNRSFEMYEYRQIISRMRLGETDRAISRAGLLGRKKATAVREIALGQGWLDPKTPLPDHAWLL